MNTQRYTTLMLAGLLSFGCGGADTVAPSPAFPAVAGAYNANGGFDNVASSDASFSGTLRLTQASQAAGTLGGSAAFTVRVGTDTYNVSQDVLNQASVSPTGVVTFAMAQNGATWTFTGNQSGNSITGGRHTLSSPAGSVSGSWTASRSSSASAAMSTAQTRDGMTALLTRLQR